MPDTYILYRVYNNMLGVSGPPIFCRGRPGPEPPSVEPDVYIRHYALPVMHAIKEDTKKISPGISIPGQYKSCFKFSFRSVNVDEIGCTKHHLLKEEQMPHGGLQKTIFNT